MAKVQLMDYQSNSRSHNGTVTFKKTRKDPASAEGGTEYRRYMGFVRDKNGKMYAPVAGKDAIGIIALNANNVRGLCGLPTYLAGQEIEINDQDLANAIQANEESDRDFENFTFVLTNFTVNQTQAMVDYLASIDKAIAIADHAEAKQRQHDWRKSVLDEIEQGKRKPLATQTPLIKSGMVGAGANSAVDDLDTRTSGTGTNEQE